MADVYGDFARRYDGMVSRNETRQKFLTGVHQEAGARNVLDCACGTGQDYFGSVKEVFEFMVVICRKQCCIKPVTILWAQKLRLTCSILIFEIFTEFTLKSSRRCSALLTLLMNFSMIAKH